MRLDANQRIGILAAVVVEGGEGNPRCLKPVNTLRDVTKREVNEEGFVRVILLHQLWIVDDVGIS